jgi:hypothetical protein
MKWFIYARNRFELGRFNEIRYRYVIVNYVYLGYVSLVDCIRHGSCIVRLNKV